MAGQQRNRVLRFAVRLANARIDAFGPEDWRKLRVQFQACFDQRAPRKDAVFIISGVTEVPEAYSERNFRALQRDVQDVLMSLSALVPSAPLVSGVRIALRKRLLPTRDGQVIPVIDGTARDVFLDVLLSLLAPAGGIRRCPACEKFFLRSRRQTHCGRRCYNRWYWSTDRPAIVRARQKQYERFGWEYGARTVRRDGNSQRVRPLRRN